jgi:hypothetical protein
MEIHTYRGMALYYAIEAGTTGFWHAGGYVELKIGETICTVFLRGARNRFTSEDAARSGFFEQANKWLDALLVEAERSAGMQGRESLVN